MTNLTSGRYFLFIVVCLLLIACEKPESGAIGSESGTHLPAGFPEIKYPEDNAYSKARWDLGKKLFYDKVLSADSTLNCGSCHKASLAFSDNIAFSKGVFGKEGTRNAPTLTNIALHPYLTREGGVPSLEMQVLVPIQEHNEFGFNIVKIAERLNSDSNYIRMSMLAYNRAPDPFVITRAIANFERTLVSGNSAYDKYTYLKDNTALSKNEIKGMKLFFSEKTNCFQCHGGYNFSDYAFENNGLYETYKDIGRMRLTGDPKDEALFKVPTLRNIYFTAPYMHDGSIETLMDVVEHYNSGGKNHPHKSKLIKPLNLNQTEKIQLVDFLNSLSDYEFISNEKHKP
ncbi:MAG: cytochrome-c peroxidase [Flavobacteriales bacterium]|nr:cytochrome-c peroxidase [Flavobacteriales bacterium]